MSSYSGRGKVFVTQSRISSLNQTFRLTRHSKYHRFRLLSRPLHLDLADSILGLRPELLLAPEDDQKLTNEARIATFNELGISLPQRLEASYTSSEEYHDSLKRLVVEETRYSISTALQSFQEKEPHRRRKDGVKIRITGDRDTNPWFEAWSYQPLNRTNRTNLRAGSVIVMVPIGREYTEENMKYGVMKYGSEKSQKCKL